MSSIPKDDLSVDAQTALVEFSTDLEMALEATSDPWAESLGHSRRSDALETKFNLPLSDTGLKEFKGDPRYRTLSSKRIAVIVKEYFDGVAEKKTTIEAPDFFAWDLEPQRIAGEIAALPNDLVAELLAKGHIAVHDWDGLTFFHASHLVNPLKAASGTFKNVYTGQAISIATVKLIKSRFRAIASANGKRKLGLKLTHIVCHADDEQDWLDVAKLTHIGGSGGEENRHRETFEVVVGDELTTAAGVYFPVAANKIGMYPWFVQQNIAPERRIHDESSAMYETKLMVGTDVIHRATAAYALPHCVAKYSV